MIALPTVLEIASIHELRALLLGELVAEEPALDASAVERVDTPALQLLCAFVASSRRAGRSDVLRSPSTALVAAARRLGLEAALGLSKDTP